MSEPFRNVYIVDIRKKTLETRMKWTQGELAYLPLYVLRNVVDVIGLLRVAITCIFSSADST